MTGVDGIHLCFIPSIDDDMVFVVNPSVSEKNVYPIAYSFYDFLSLLLSCTEFSAIEQPVDNEKYFNKFVYELNKTSSVEKIAGLKRLQDCLNIIPCSNPYRYLKELQKGFDYSLIPYSKEYYD